MRQNGKIYLEVMVEEVSLNEYFLPSGALLVDKDFEEILDIILSTGVLNYRASDIIAMYVCGYTLREIAQKYNFSINTAAKYIKKGIEKLRNYYSSHPCYFDWCDVYEEITLIRN